MYDDLAAYYHLIFENWDASIARQAGVLGPLIERACGKARPRILDAACGIGTQAIGLAMRGHTVLLATLRDYDALVCERPAFHGPAFYEDAGYGRIVHQVWDWTGDTGYTMHLYITRETASGRRVSPACAGSSRAKADTINLDYARSLPFGARRAITRCQPNSAQPSLIS